MTCAELANADTACYTCAQFIGIIDRSRRKPGILRQKLDYIVEARNNQTGANVVAAAEIHAEIESLVQCLERTTKCNLYNILPMLKFKLFAIEIKDKQANC
jgi:hypothetical protein